MEKEEAIELVQNLKDIRDEIIALLNQANQIVEKYDKGTWVRGVCGVYDLHYLNSDIRNIERKEGLGQ